MTLIDLIDFEFEYEFYLINPILTFHQDVVLVDDVRTGRGPSRVDVGGGVEISTRVIV